MMDDMQDVKGTMLAVAVSFFLGDTWVQCLPVLSATGCLIPLSLAALVTTLIRTRFVAYCAIAFVVGVLWASGHAWWQLHDDLQRELEGRDVTLTGVIATIPQHESYGVRFVLVTDEHGNQLPSRLQISWYSQDAPVHAGEHWRLCARLKRRHGFANPGSFGYEGQLFAEGIGGTGYVRESADNQQLGVASGYAVLRMRASLAERISAAIPDSPMQGVVRGLAVGDQQAITNDQWQIFARSGISHLIAISGSHIGMVALLFAWLGGWLIHLPVAQRCRLTKQDLQAAFGLPAAVAYSLMAGMSIPTQRTLIMLSVFFLSRQWRREVNVWHSFGLALLLVTLIDPFAPLAIGTWLSFGAVAVILLNQQGRLGREAGWREFLTLQMAVTLGLAPFLISAFGNVSLISPWVNLLAIPIFTVLLVPAVLIGSLLLVINTSLAAWWLHHLATLMEFFYHALQWAASSPSATWYLAHSSWWALGLMCAGALLLVLPLLWPTRLCGVLCCLPALLWQPAKLSPQSFELTALDVGQGLSLVIRTASHVMVYDTGPKFQSGSDTAGLVVLPYLRSLGIRHLDLVMISHGDDDHAGGMGTLEQGMPASSWIVGPSVSTTSLTHANWIRCQRNQQWKWDEVRFEVLSPTLSDGEGRNNTSCVLRIETPTGSALLMGDAEAPVEQQLVSNGRISPASIVVAGHHGSRTSSIPEFVNAVQAREVIFSAGYLNRWDFPKADIVSRWQASGAQTHSTIDAGAITVRITPQGIQRPQWYRVPQRHYWQISSD